MDRRSFLLTSGSFLAAVSLPAQPAFAERIPTYGRMILPMNRNWRYHPSKVEGAEAVGFDDSAFERVTLPHTNISLPWHSFDDKEYEFVSTYRRSFLLPSQAKGKRVFVDFEGAMTASTVWIKRRRVQGWVHTLLF